MKINNPDRLDKYDWPKISEKANKIQNWPMEFEDKSPMTIPALKRTCRNMVKSGCKVIFIDQLNKIRTDKRQDRFAEATDCTMECGCIARELKTRIFLLAQLNRDPENRKNNRPILPDLKNTGSLEEEADAVIFPFRPQYYTKKDEDKNKAEIILSKNRNGAVGKIDCHWDEVSMLFTEVYKQ